MGNRWGPGVIHPGITWDLEIVWDLEITQGLETTWVPGTASDPGIPGQDSGFQGLP